MAESPKTLSIVIDVPDLTADIHEADFAEKVAERVRKVAEVVASDITFAEGGVKPLLRYVRDRGRVRGEAGEPSVIAVWRYNP